MMRKTKADLYLLLRSLSLSSTKLFLWTACWSDLEMISILFFFSIDFIEMERINA